MGCGRLARALFVLLLSTLMCCQPAELIWLFLFHKLSIFTSPDKSWFWAICFIIFQFYSPQIAERQGNVGGGLFLNLTEPTEPAYTLFIEGHVESQDPYYVC